MCLKNWEQLACSLTLACLFTNCICGMSVTLVFGIAVGVTHKYMLLIVAAIMMIVSCILCIICSVVIHRSGIHNNKQPILVNNDKEDKEYWISDAPPSYSEHTKYVTIIKN